MNHNSKVSMISRLLSCAPRSIVAYRFQGREFTLFAPERAAWGQVLTVWSRSFLANFSQLPCARPPSARRQSKELQLADLVDQLFEDYVTDVESVSLQQFFTADIPKIVKSKLPETKRRCQNLIVRQF